MHMLRVLLGVTKFLILSILVGCGFFVMVPIWGVVLIIQKLTKLPGDTIIATILTIFISALIGLWWSLALRK